MTKYWKQSVAKLKSDIMEHLKYQYLTILLYHINTEIQNSIVHIFTEILNLKYWIVFV